MSSGSINREIFGASIIVALMTMFVKVAALGKELIVAWKFGTGDELDAFLIALLVPSFITNVVAGSFNAALIPTYIQVREKEGTEAAQKLFSGTTIWSLGLLLITTILMLVTAPLYLFWIGRGFSPEKFNLTLHLLYASTPVVLLSGLKVIWGAVLNARERFALTALSPTITPCVSVLFLLICQSWGSFALIAGLVSGTFLELAVLGAALKEQKISLCPRWHGFNPYLNQVIKQYVPMIAGAVLMSSTNLVDQSMAAMLSPGSVAALNYGNKVVTFPLNLAVVVLGTTALPYFSKMVACKNWIGIRHALKCYFSIIFLVTVPITGFLFFFSETIIRMFFQKGAFTLENTYLVAQIQAFYSLQIPFFIAGILMVKLLSSIMKNHILMGIAVINLITNIVLNFLFVRKFGVAGIALSTSFVYLVSFLILLYYWRRFAEKKLSPI